MTEVEKLKRIKKACIKNAEDLLGVAEKNIDNGVDHISFHLALLALEEIGKSTLVAIAFTVSLAGKERRRIDIAIDDHIKKLFWALWGGFIRGGKYIKEDIEKSRELATSLHERRLFYLYTDPNDPKNPNSKIRKGEARSLIQLAKAKLKLEKLYKINVEINEEEVENLKLFFDTVEDPDKRKSIFSGSSMKKLHEFKDGKKWIDWIASSIRRNNEEMKKLAEKELNREEPSGKERFEPKFKMRVRIQSQSHNVRKNAFEKWNSGVNDIKIYKANKKQLSNFAKSELLIDFFFPKNVPIHGLWGHSLFIVKSFLLSLNIATKGIFWWNVPKDVDKFFESIADLEADNKGGVLIGLRIGKRLTLDWDKEKLTLKQEDIKDISMVSSFLIREHEKMKKVLQHYALAMAIFSKIDIHLRIETNAFQEFFYAFKEALIALENYDEREDILQVAKKAFKKSKSFDSIEKTLKLGAEIKPEANPQITLTEVMSMKWICDLYLHFKIHDYFIKIIEQEKKLSTKTEEEK